jgi:hypothetical protein
MYLLIQYWRLIFVTASHGLDKTLSRGRSFSWAVVSTPPSHVRGKTILKWPEQ